MTTPIVQRAQEAINGFMNAEAIAVDQAQVSQLAELVAAAVLRDAAPGRTWYRAYDADGGLWGESSSSRDALRWHCNGYPVKQLSNVTVFAGAVPWSPPT